MSRQSGGGPITILPGASILPHIPSSTEKLVICSSIENVAPFKAKCSGVLKVIVEGSTTSVVLKGARTAPEVAVGAELLCIKAHSGTKGPAGYHNLVCPNLPAYSVMLPALAFNGATQRNRPTIEQVGVVFCKVKEIKGAVIVATCEDGRGKDHNVKRENVYGALEGGMLVDKLEKRTVQQMGRKGLKFEAAIGSNGLGWIGGEGWGVGRVREGEPIDRVFKKLKGSSSGRAK